MKQDNKLQRLFEDEQEGVTGGGVIYTECLGLWRVTNNKDKLVIGPILDSDGKIQGWGILCFENQEDAQRYAREHGYSDQVMEWP